jgi:hypothetical protein
MLECTPIKIATRARTSTLGLPSALLKQGRALLHQQCWLWGQDVRRTQGNILIQYGFDRIRPPHTVCGSNQYTLRFEKGRQIRLWGFGMFYGTRERGIYINRFEFLPRLARMRGDVWQPDEMNESKFLSGTFMLRAALRWIAEYEEWVLRVYGATYRNSCLAGWEHAEPQLARVHESWIQLAGNIERFARTRENRSLQPQC